MDHETNTTGRRRCLFAAAAAVVVALGAGIATTQHVSGHGWSARAVLRDVEGRRVGTVHFDGSSRGTTITVDVRGVAVGRDAFHGLHVHANPTEGAECDGSTTPPFTNVGPHWNPTNAIHGQHAGDLPPVLVDSNGNGTADSRTTRLDPATLVGRAVILHGGADNLANVPTRYTSGDPPVAGPDDATKGTGDAGDRIACGVITRD